MKIRYLHMVLVLLLLPSCRKETTGNNNTGHPADTAVSMTPYDIVPPAHFPPLLIPADNKPYVERIRLGRMLYYDNILSNNGKACASCHLQANGFTINAKMYDMPVLPHVNLAWNTNYMWNGSKKGSLEEVMLFEVSEFFATNLEKVNNDKVYRDLFKEYYGVDQITHKDLAYALAQFVRTMISRDTKYDRFLKGIENLTEDELQGRNIFFSEKGDCFHCHVNPVMTDNQFHNTGVDSVYTRALDKGLFNVTGNMNDLGKFKTPNLRNVTLRKYYMHDGRFTTLEEVVQFYNSGVNKVATLDPIMTKPGKENGLGLTTIEQYQLIQFLHTLTDSTFINDTTLSGI